MSLTDFASFKPDSDLPEVGLEFPRFPSPPVSLHSSLDGNPRPRQSNFIPVSTTTSVFSKKKFRNERNKQVHRYLQSRVIIIKFKSKHKPRSVFEDSSDSKNSVNTGYPGYCARLSKAKIIKSLLANEEKKRKDGPDSVQFDHTKLAMIQNVQWTLVKMDRMEKLLTNGTIEPFKSSNASHFLFKWYGHFDLKSRKGRKILNEFTRAMKIHINEMTQHEATVARKWTRYHPDKSDPRLQKMINDLVASRVQLQEKLDNELASLSDPCKAIYCLGMDFLKLPRSLRTIRMYGIKAKQLKSFVEFQDKAVPTVYNPALFDVGWNYPKKSSFPPTKCFWKGLQDKPSVTSDNLKLYNAALKNFIMKFKRGVSLETFERKFKIEYNLRYEQIINVLPLTLSIDLLPDIFYSQKMSGPGDRCILFPGIYRGVIVSPEETLSGFWNGIRMLVDMKLIVKVDEIGSMYTRLTNRRFFPRYWGFSNVFKFVEWSIANLTDATKDLELIEVDEEKRNVLHMGKLVGKDVSVDDQWRQIESEDKDGIYCSEEDLKKWESLMNSKPKLDRKELPVDAVYRLIN